MVILTPITINNHFNNANYVTKVDKVNFRASYQTYLDKHILPTLGDYLMTEITPAMLNKMLLDFQKQGYKHSTTIKLYNILNGIFDMAFMDYSIQINPMQRVQRPKQPKDEKQVPAMADIHCPLCRYRLPQR